MSESILTERVEQLFASALAQTYQREGLSALHSAIQQSWKRLKQPMRVALIGVSGAGKSTMLNALPGEIAVTTGSAKSELLKAFAFIDIPGLASFYADDSQETSEFLKPRGQELTEIMQHALAHVDAILYLFSQNPGAEGKAVLELFQGSQIGRATPINAIGVLARADILWPSYSDALAGGKQMIETLQADHPRLCSLFSTIVPVSGFLAWGAQTLTPEEFVTLQHLACLPEARLQKLLHNIERFTRRKYQNVPITPARRKAVLDRLGTYGIWRAYHLLCAGISEQESLVQALLQDSGLPTLKQQILSHLGERAYLIKLGGALRQIKSACFEAQNNNCTSPAEREVVRQIGSKFGQLEDQALGLSGA